MKLKIFLLLMTAFFVAYGVWRGDVNYEYNKEYAPVDSVVISFGSVSDAGKGNLVGVQPFMESGDYSSPEAFFNAVNNYLFDASSKQFLNAKTIVVFPEYLGTWLVAMGEKPAVYQAVTVSDAMTQIVLRHPIDFVRYYFKAKGSAPDKEAIFQLKSAEMAEAYYQTFSKLASKYEVTIVAGSILLPEPYADEKRILRVKPGEKLYNVTAVFNPDGIMNPSLAKKIYPIDDEKGFVCAAELNSLPVFDTPAGKLGVLVCADSWYPEPYQVLKQKGVELLAVPSYAAGDGLWSKPWAGYNGAPMPVDVNKSDVGKITEREAWEKYAMGGGRASANIGFGVNVFLRGKLWDLGADGETMVTGDGHVLVGPANQPDALITNVWIK